MRRVEEEGKSAIEGKMIRKQHFVLYNELKWVWAGMRTLSLKMFHFTSLKDAVSSKMTGRILIEFKMAH